MSNIIFVQPSLASYRLGFFNRVYKYFPDRLIVFASSKLDMEFLDNETLQFKWLTRLRPIKTLPFGLEWQSGTLSIPINTKDILIISGQPRTLSNFILILRAKLAGARIVWWGHFWSASSKEWRAKIRYKIISFADACLFYTDAEILRYRKLNKSRSKFVFALNNGLEQEEIISSRDAYISRLRSRDIFFIGRITEKCGLDLLLDALNSDGCKNITMDVIGDGSMLDFYKTKSDSLGLNQRIKWHESTVCEKDIAGIANKCKIFVYPGSVGLSLIHGFSYGLPAIIHSNRMKQMPESDALVNNKNGVYFRQSDHISLAQEIIALLSNEKKLDLMSKNAIDTAKQYSTAGMSIRLKKLILELDGL